MHVPVPPSVTGLSLAFAVINIDSMTSSFEEKAKFHGVPLEQPGAPGTLVASVMTNTTVPLFAMIVIVNRRANGTPYRRAKGTPCKDRARLM